MINSANHFVVFDEVQYTRRDWRSRNKIKMSGGPTWLSIPVEVKGKYFQTIGETRIADQSWARQHWASISQSYAKAPFFKLYRDTFSGWYEKAASLEYLSEVNCLFLQGICTLIGINTKFHQSSLFNLAESKSERLLNVCLDLGATRYLSGPAAKDYLDESIFKAKNIDVAWADYTGYPEYDQLYPPFEHFVSVLDLLFMTGPNCRTYMKSFGAATKVESKVCE